MTNIRPPTDEELSDLQRRHAHRHPELAHLDVIGDRGKALRLPLLVGNPSGACKMRETEKVSPAWSDIVRGRAVAGLASQLLADCVLFPDPATLAEWCDRWPAIGRSIANGLIVQKVAGDPSAISTPADDEAPPAPIAAALDEYPRACWRKLAGGGDTFAVVVDPPSSAVYRIYEDAVAGDDRWQPTRELVELQVKACARIVPGKVAKPCAIGDLIDRFPGFAIWIVSTISHLVGARAELELGEF